MPSPKVVMVRPDPKDDGVGTGGGMRDWSKPQNNYHLLVTDKSKDRTSLTPMLCLQAAKPVPRLYSELEGTAS